MKDNFKDEIDEIFRSLSDEKVMRFVGRVLHMHGIELNPRTRHWAADILQAWLSRPDSGCKRPAEEACKTFGLNVQSHYNYKARARAIAKENEKNLIKE